MTNATPMLRQYRQLKARFTDAILMFRLGDFYEMFEKDAETVSRQLGLVLTSRRFSNTVKLPMCGIPYRQLTVYVSRLLSLGHKVAIAEQEDSRKAGRLIGREVVRVITPGTVVEEALLAEKVQNYLVALAPQPPDQDPTALSGWGLAAVDLSTGEFVATQFQGPEAWSRLREELDVLQPSEMILPDYLAEKEEWKNHLQGTRPARLSPLEARAFEPEAARQRLLAHLGTPSLEPHGCANQPLATAAAGAALCYLQQSQLSSLAHLRDLESYSPEASVGLDAVTRRNLELTGTLRDGQLQGSLLGVLDRTVTAMGARLLRRWVQQPLVDLLRIRERLDAVEELVGRSEPDKPASFSPTVNGGEPRRAEGFSPFLRPDLRRLLDGLYDMERLVGRIGFGTANARDLVALRRTLLKIPAIKALLADARSSRLRALNAGLDELQDVAGAIGRALVEDPPILIREGGLIQAGYHGELDGLRGDAAAGRDWLAGYEAMERERTGIPSLRVRYNEVFGFFVQVPRSKSSQVPPEYERRATISHAERYVTPPLQARQAEVLAAEERANELEYQLFVDLRQQVAAQSERLLKAARTLAELDALSALAEVAARHNYTRPAVDDSLVIEIQDGRHPVVEQMMPEGKRFVANNTRLDAAGQRLLIVTGPNMSGKSVFARQVALIVLLAQAGSFVPARAAHVGLVDRIFVRAGASDDITQGRSTFLVEMGETAHILRNATRRSLVILDEVGRGTSTYDGMALAWAVGEELHDRISARTLFATHFHELTCLADELGGARNASMAVKEQGQEVVFLYRLVDGGADRSFGIQVAGLAGIPEHVVARARQVMERLESSRQLQSLQQIDASYPAGSAPAQLLVPAQDEAVWKVVQEVFELDIANLTPVQALVLLNEMQQLLRRRE